MNWLARLQIWLANRRVEILRDECEYHRTCAISAADQAQQIERQIVLARLELGEAEIG